jgi:hypothetical protein
MLELLALSPLTFLRPVIVTVDVEKRLSASSLRDESRLKGNPQRPPRLQYKSRVAHTGTRIALRGN